MDRKYSQNATICSSPLGHGEHLPLSMDVCKKESINSAIGKIKAEDTNAKISKSRGPYDITFVSFHK